MFWEDLESLFNNIFHKINTNNKVPDPSEIWNEFEPVIRSLLNQNFNDQFVQLSTNPTIFSPVTVEAARLFSLLKQRRTRSEPGRDLVGRIRAVTIKRNRPPFNVSAHTLNNELLTIAKIGNNSHYSQFQISGWEKVLKTIEKRDGLVILAPTGAGKSEVFMLPLMYQVAQALETGGNPNNDPRFILIYPRVELLKDQLERLFRYAYRSEEVIFNGKLTPSRGSRSKGVIIGFQFAGVSTDSNKTLQDENLFIGGKRFRLIENCPICNLGHLEVQPKYSGITPLKCTNSSCDAVFNTTISKKDHVKVKPHFLVTTSESLSRFYLSSQKEYDEYLKSITGIIFDEAHLYYSLEGAHLYNLIKNIEALRNPSDKLVKIASSATITSPETFAAKLFYGREQPAVEVHDASFYESEPSGLEVLLFLQSPNYENSPLPTSTMIQTAMALGHGVFSEKVQNSMDRAILFTDSVDIANRFQAQIQDAESDGLLWSFRTEMPVLYNGIPCPGLTPKNCPDLYLKGECWRGIVGGIECTRTTALRSNPMTINCVSSQNRSNYWDGEIVVATSSLEVGVDDSRIKATLHYRPPRDVFSFIQRRGRAGRSRGDIAYSIMVLGNESSDQFYLYRRNRLLSAQNYELPLNPNNPVISQMHQLLLRERSKLRNLADKYKIQRGILEWFYNALKGCAIINTIYSKTLNTFKNYAKYEAQQLALLQWFTDEREKYKKSLNIFWILEEVENQSPGTLLPGIEEIRTLLVEFFDGNKALQPVIQEKILALSSSLENLILEEQDSEVINQLDKLKSKLRDVWRGLTTANNLNLPSETLKGLYDFFNTLCQKLDQKWKFNYAPEMIKGVLQAFFYLGIETRKDITHNNCEYCIDYFIPDAAFQQVKPLLVEVKEFGAINQETRIVQESVSDLASMFYPYKTIFRYFGSQDLTVIETTNAEGQARVVNGVPTVFLDVRGEGIRETDRFIPQKIQVRSVRSDEDGNGFVKICETCYTVFGLNRTVRCHGPLLAVKLYADPIIQRNARLINDFPPEPITRTLDFLELEGETKVLGSNVSGNKLVWTPNNPYQWTKHQIEFNARFTSPIAYSIPTKGIRWKLDEIVQCVLSDTNLKSQMGAKPLTTELILHTAVHMLYKAAASISGVNLNVLEYAIDSAKNHVFIWERYDGGAGITETIRESIKTNPAIFYRELLASVLCPISLDEDPTWSNAAVLKSRLAKLWHLPNDDSFLELLIAEAEAERNQIELKMERQREGAVSCADGCPVCIQVTTCTENPSQSSVTSRKVAEKILQCFLQKVDSDGYKNLVNENLSRDVLPPTMLFTELEKGESGVLLL